MRPSTGLTAALLLAASLASPGAARSQCGVSAGTCVCGIREADGVLEGVVLEAIAPLAQFEVEAVHGEGGGYEPGDRVALAWRGAEVSGLRMLLNLRDGEVVFRQAVTRDGQAVCPAAGFQTPVADAVAAVLSEDCPAALADLGFAASACGDSGGGAVGCASAGGGGDGSLGVLIALGLLARTRRGRRPGPAARPRSSSAYPRWCASPDAD